MDEKEILQRLITQPETYRSLLGNEYGRNTCTVLTKKKILRAIKWGWIRRIELNGTRGGEVLLTHSEKKYTIIISLEHNNFLYFYCDKMKNINTMKILAVNCYRLDDDKWLKIGDNEIFKGYIIKII